MAWFWSCEAGSNTLMQLVQLKEPSPHFFEGWSDFITYGIFLGIHDLLQSFRLSLKVFLPYRMPDLLENFMKFFSFFLFMVQIKSATVVWLGEPVED
jgi:hypothetical protein